jgi:type II secretory pathway predicted ATPase ExeA
LLGVITGEVGVGKTVAVRAAISQLDHATHHVVYVANPPIVRRSWWVQNVLESSP